MSQHNPLTGPLRSKSIGQNAHIWPTNETREYRAKAIAGKEKELERIALAAYARWMKEKKKK